MKSLPIGYFQNLGSFSSTPSDLQKRLIGLFKSVLGDFGFYPQSGCDRKKARYIFPCHVRYAFYLFFKPKV